MSIVHFNGDNFCRDLDDLKEKSDAEIKELDRI